MFLCGNFALKPLQIGEVMSNNKIMQFSYFYWNTNEKKGDEKTTLFHVGICHDCDNACASGKMHHGILFARLVFYKNKSTEEKLYRKKKN